MNRYHVWTLLACIALPIAMSGACSSVQFGGRGQTLTPFHVSGFQTGHAHSKAERDTERTVGSANTMQDRPTTIEGLTTIPSSFGAKETMDRLEAEVRAKGMTVFARIDHAAGAAQAGLPLRPTEVLLFGNAKGGTPLMQSNQTIGIDLPLKALAWEDEAGKTWLSYNVPAWLAQRHGVTAPDAVAAMTSVIAAVAKAATTPS